MRIEIRDQTRLIYLLKIHSSDLAMQSEGQDRLIPPYRLMGDGAASKLVSNHDKYVAQC